MVQSAGVTNILTTPPGKGKNTRPFVTERSLILIGQNVRIWFHQFLPSDIYGMMPFNGCLWVAVIWRVPIRKCDLGTVTFPMRSSHSGIAQGQENQWIARSIPLLCPADNCADWRRDCGKGHFRTEINL